MRFRNLLGYVHFFNNTKVTCVYVSLELLTAIWEMAGVAVYQHYQSINMTDKKKKNENDDKNYLQVYSNIEFNLKNSRLDFSDVDSGPWSYSHLGHYK